MSCKGADMELPCVTRHCLLHAVQVLKPSDVHQTLPRSGLRTVESFCKELSQLTQQKKKGISLPDPLLLQTIDVHKFEEGAITAADFTQLVEQQLLRVTKGEVDLDALQRLCWSYYEADKRSTISFPKWLSLECTYRLWLIFNTVHDYDLVTSISQSTVNEVVKRLIELCGYTWNKAYQYTKQKEVEFPEYIEAITDYFDQLHLETSLTCEVIASLVDEVVNGVIRTGHLKKKGHKRKNWLKRWFVLQRTILRYYETRDAVKLKGQLVLNGRTEVQSVPDTANKKYQFVVTCGHTGVPFKICADDQQAKQEWILAIRKAIALARIIEGGSSAKQDSFTESVAGFYLLKYGTKKPTLSHQDSELEKMKYHMTLGQFQRLSEAGREDSTRQSVTSTSSDDEPQEEYLEMQPGVLTADNELSESIEEEEYLQQHVRSDTADECEELPYEIPVPLRTPSGGKSSPKGGTPTSPTEKPLIVIEPRSEETPPPVVEQSKSPLLYRRRTVNQFQQNSDVNGSHSQDTRESMNGGQGSIDLESPPAVSEDDTKLSPTMCENSPPSLDTKRDMRLRQTSLPNTNLLSEEGEKPPIPPRKSRSKSFGPVHKLSPTITVPPGSQVIDRDAPLDTPPIPPPRLTPKHQKKLTGNVPPLLVVPDENPPPVPRHRTYRSPPPDSPIKIRPASTIGIPLKDSSEDTTYYKKSPTPKPRNPAHSKSTNAL